MGRKTEFNHREIKKKLGTHQGKRRAMSVNVVQATDEPEAGAHEAIHGNSHESSADLIDKERVNDGGDETDAADRRFHMSYFLGSGNSGKCSLSHLITIPARNGSFHPAMAKKSDKIS